MGSVLQGLDEEVTKTPEKGFMKKKSTPNEQSTQKKEVSEQEH